MKKYLLLIFVLFLLGCTGRNYEAWESCHQDCIGIGYDDGNCFTFKSKPLLYKEVGTIGSCQITSGARSMECGVEGSCNCYCYNLLTEDFENVLSGHITRILAKV